MKTGLPGFSITDRTFASFAPHALKGQKLQKQHALKGQKLQKQHALKGRVFKIRLKSDAFIP